MKVSSCTSLISCCIHCVSHVLFFSIFDDELELRNKQIARPKFVPTDMKKKYMRDRLPLNGSAQYHGLLVLFLALLLLLPNEY